MCPIPRRHPKKYVRILGGKGGSMVRAPRKHANESFEKSDLPVGPYLHSVAVRERNTADKKYNHNSNKETNFVDRALEDCETEVFMFAFDVRKIQPSNAQRAWPNLYRSAWRRSDSVAEHTNHLAINLRR